ncbi:HNHc-like endonuclease [Clavibacter phage CMP1]|uniref:HNHc-like endonuclease n=1 Tax=Clavibacter phage CMP1 TaxID=686439 RepID=D0U1Y6_9CAUD|nr:HNH endonuclease [Clavibacter phage CMP1]ACY35898.1 HNHc-like endonuclease [Clavibacter phage CMP1]
MQQFAPRVPMPKMTEEETISRMRLAATPTMTAACITPDRRQRHAPKNVKMFVRKRDKYRCVVCGRRNNLTLDHIYPRGFGGCSHAHNLQVLCLKHNLEKGLQKFNPPNDRA